MSRIPLALRRHPIALLALFVALGGTSFAATQLPKNSVGAKQIKKNAVSSKKVKNGSLLAADFKAGELPAAAQGPKGDKGDRGPQGPTGPAGSDAEFDGAAASGDLDGTYPNPEIAAGAVGPDELGTTPGITLMYPTVIDTADGTCDETLPAVPSALNEIPLYFLSSSSDLGGGIEYGCADNKPVATIQRAGVYQMTLTVMWATNGTGSRGAGIRIGNSAGTFHTYAGESRGPASTTTNTAQSVSATLDLAVGDIVQPYVVQDSGTDLGFVQDGRTRMTLKWISN